MSLGTGRDSISPNLSGDLPIYCLPPELSRPPDFSAKSPDFSEKLWLIIALQVIYSILKVTTFKTKKHCFIH